MQQVLPSGIEFVFLVLQGRAIHGFKLLVPEVYFVLQCMVLLFFPGEGSFLVGALLDFYGLLRGKSFKVRVVGADACLGIECGFQVSNDGLALLEHG